MTALHYVLLKMARDEEGYITKDYFKSFKLNFRQSTIIWLISVVFIVILYLDFRFLDLMENKTFMFATLTAASVLLYCTLLYVFPILSHFENTIKGTVKNAFFMSILALPRTVVMVLVTLLPPAIIFFVLKYGAMGWLIPLVALFWIGAPGYVCAKLYSSVFRRFEPETAQIENDDFSWTVGGQDEDVDNGDTTEETVETED